MTIAELRKLAEAATPGPWKAIPSMHGTEYECVQYGADEAYCSLEMLRQDARFSAACTPERIAALCDCAEALRVLLDALNDRSRAYYPSEEMEERARAALRAAGGDMRRRQRLCRSR